MGQLILCVLGMYTILDYSAGRGVPYWRQAYAVVCVCVVLSLARKHWAGRVSRRIGMILVIWMGLSVFWFLPALAHLDVYWIYIVGDLAMVVLPALFLLAGCRYPNLFDDEQSLRGLGAWLLVAAIIAPLLANQLWSSSHHRGGRFDPPDVLLMAILWVALVNARSPLHVLACLALVIGTGLLSFLSGMRTHLGLWVLAGMIAIAGKQLTLRTARYFIGVCAVGIVAIVILAAATDKGVPGLAQLKSAISSSRYSKLGSKDQSLANRIDEVRDVLLAIRSNPNPLAIFFGNGHGATFSPVRSFPERNITRDFRVHQIHIGPAMLLYRYGLIGLAIAAWCCFMVGADVLWLIGGRNISRAMAVFVIAMVLSLTNGMFRNVLNEPMFSFTLAGYLYLRFATNRQQIWRLSKMIQPYP